MKKMSKILALMLALVMVLALFAGCNNTDKPADTTKAAETKGQETTTPATEAPVTTEAPDVPAEYVATAAQLVANKEYGADKDYISLYDKFGKEASIADVEEDPDTGLAYFNAPDGK